MKYKAGDKVRIKSLNWYKANECSSRVMCDGIAFDEKMTEWCGKELTIDLVYTNDEGRSLYIMKEPENQWRFTDSMIEGLVEYKDKMVSLDVVCDKLLDMLFVQDINDQKMVGTWKYDNVTDFIKNFRKVMEK